MRKRPFGFQSWRHVITPAALVCFVILAGRAAAMWATPSDAPVGRLITNVTKYVKEHPQDAQGHFTLARIHSLAFALKSDSIATWNEEKDREGRALPSICTNDFQGMTLWIAKAVPTPEPRKEELRLHLTESVRSFERALALDDKPALYHLGLAYVMEQGTVLADETDIVPGATPIEKLSAENKAEIDKLIDSLGVTKESERKRAAKALRERLGEAANVLLERRKDDDAVRKGEINTLIREQWRAQTLKYYLSAYKSAIAEDSKITEQPMRGLRVLASYEAGKAYVKLMSARIDCDDAEKRQLAEVQQGIKGLEAKPANMAMTPIIFSLGGVNTLGDLLAPGSCVMFDLDGDGRAEPRPWVRPDTGILVWDPSHSGVITSGRQLFGSVTWWMFFDNGYHALDALDDDRDGTLAGTELEGLAVWFDRNGNGISEAGEVVPIERLPIQSLATDATSMDAGSPANLLGLVLTDGHVVPTYDWIVPAMNEQRAPVIDVADPVLLARKYVDGRFAFIDPAVLPRRVRVNRACRGILGLL